MTTAAPPKKPPPPKAAAPNGLTPTTPKTYQISRGEIDASEGIVIYGTGGVGKSTLASLARNPIFIDVDNGSHHLDAARINNIENWADLKSILMDKSIFADFDTVVLDSLTRAEELCKEHILSTITGPQNKSCTSIEGYGYGKGYTYVFEEMRRLLPLLDAHKRAGRTVVIICHDTTARVPNPSGEDWIRYEPRLQNVEKCNVRSLVKEWADHVLFIGYDVFSEDGKASGSGTRTIYCQELPTHVAKSRTLRESIPCVENNSSLWQMLLKEMEVADANAA